MNHLNLKPIFSGIQKFTTKDYPDKLSATLFTLGCNLKCKYCYNLEFLKFDKNKLINNDKIIEFLKKRINTLDAIVICGGEPTLHNESLIEWIKYIKSLGYKIKLDTNGTNPKLLKKLLNLKLINCISLDFKGLGNKKFQIVTQVNLFSKFQTSLKLVIESGIKYDIRTTVHSSLLNLKELEKMQKYLINIGCENWALQKFLDVKIIDPSIGKDKSNINDWLKFSKKFRNFEIRN